ncbi:helitron_like_N domain-containing protein [Trichonephila clavipes]|nr:helitron_like_N domain-containing protein [Trichonephila clavipes]
MNNDTVTNVDGYPIYRRRNPENGGQSFIKNINNTDIDIDNRWVVPYSPLLSKTYNAHINVEFCSSVKSIKYICNSNEAAWRIFGFPIHERDPAVVQLAIHLENGQRVFFTNETAIDRAINPPKTTLTAFLNCVIVRMILVLLHEHYSIHKYHAISHGLKQKHGCPASKAHQLLHVSIYLNQTPWGDYLQSVQDTECFYLRLLLVNVTGPLSFQDIKVNGQQYQTYKDACLALGLLEDDNQWECMLAEVALNCTAIQIRRLFAIVLTTCFPARAQILWEIHKDSMTDDILHQHRIRCHDPTITFSDEMYNEALIAIEDLLHCHCQLTT